MRTRSPDTHPDAERAQVELFRRVGPARRFALARSLSLATAQLAKRAIRRRNPEAASAEIEAIFAASHYGRPGGRDLYARNQGGNRVAPFDILAAFVPVAEAFHQIGISYYVAGSAASVIHGISRTTLDVDLVANLSSAQVQPLADQLQDAYYLDIAHIREAIQRRSSFNLVHLETMVKVDVFVSRNRPYDREIFRRVRPESFEEGDSGRQFPVLAPEDVVLTKLEWYEQGRHVSDRQWTDVLGVLRVQNDALDLAYLRHWAGELGIGGLLDQALSRGGLVG